MDHQASQETDHCVFIDFFYRMWQDPTSESPGERVSHYIHKHTFLRADKQMVRRVKQARARTVRCRP